MEEVDETNRLASVFASERAAAMAWLATSRDVAIAPRAAESLADWLVFRLASCAQTVLDDERRRLGIAPEELGAYIRDPARWSNLLARYPVVARLLARSEQRWRSTVEAYLARIASDHDHRELVDVRVRAGRLAARRPTLLTTLAGDSRWVYRTNGREMARWFQELCAALGPRLSLALHVRKIIAGDDYSWDELVPTAPCTDDAARQRFFLRAGMYIRLAERLAAVDLHCENILAAGDHPVLVDIETLFAPDIAATTPALEALLRSPLRSGLLHPASFGDAGRPAVSRAGLHPGGRLVMPIAALRLAPMDGPTGGLVEVYPVETIAPTIPAPLGDHVEDLLTGYDEMERVLAACPDLCGLLERAPRLPVRALGVGGGMHDRALHAGLAVDLLQDDAARDAYLATCGLSPDEQLAIRDLELPRHMTVVGPHPATSPMPAWTAAELARRHDLIRTTVALVDDRVPSPRPTQVPSQSFTAHAVEIGDFLLAVRFAGGDWHGAVWVPWAGARTIDVIGPDLLSGRAGLALAFASLARVTGLPRFAAAARNALDAVRGHDMTVALGGYVGLGGAAYALARCGELLGESQYVDEARTQIALLSADRIREAPHDLVLGTAGLLRVVSALGVARPDLVAAVERGEPRSSLLPGGYPGWVPDVATARAFALGHSVSPLAWQPRIDTEAAAAVLAEPRDVLDDVDLALAAAGEAPADPRFPAVLRDRAARAIAERARTGRWFPATSIAERHDLSVLTGLPAMLLALLAADAPGELRSIRRLE